ncbi:MAG: outer membrane protein assembly factor BamA [Proteobacteria bacterium]|nr:outer membrane protein assembly factor BamA [Pseudomonadota bacterium]
MKVRHFRRCLCALLYSACLLCMGLSEVSAQPAIYPEHSDVIVDEIVLKGNHRNPNEDLLYYIKQSTGTKLSLDVVSEDVKRLFRMKLYDDIQVDLDVVNGRNILTYYFVEKPSIASYEFEGNDAVGTDDLKEKVDLRIASPLDLDKINDNVRKIKAHYDNEGYFLAEVTSEIRDREDGDKDVIFHIREYDKVKVRRITILGNEAISDADIKAHIFTREASLLGKLSGAGEYKEEEFKRDLQRIAAWYSENGYPDAHVTDSQVQLSEDRGSMYITFSVEEGHYTTVGNVDVAGDLLEDEDEIKKLITVKPGEGFKLSQLFEDVKNIQDYYGDRGYAYAQVEPRRRAGSTPNTLDIGYEIHPGEPVRIGKILISGNQKTEDKVIRREILVNEGELYHGSKVHASEASIQRTGYFEKVSVTTQAGKEENTIDMLVEVTERSTGQFQIGAGFSSTESFIGTLQVSYDNFLGRGHFLAAQGTISKLRQLFNVQYFNPYFFDSMWRFRASVFNYEYVYTDFTRESYGGNIGFGYPFTRDLVLDLTYTLENVDVSTGSFGSKQRNLGSILDGGRTSSLNATLTYDRRNNRLLPTKGFMLMGSVDFADQYIGSENEYIRFLGRARAYVPLFWDIVLKFNLELGYIANWNAPNKEVPIFERFFVGGPNSVRGFERSSLGPSRSFTTNVADPTSTLTNFQIGGNKEIVFNAEIEIPILKSMNISGVVFFDMGNAYNEDQNLSLMIDWFAKNDEEHDTMMRSAMGFGFRWMSPMGLLRFEWGFPLSPKKNEDPVVFEFSIGNAF